METNNESEVKFSTENILPNSLVNSNTPLKGGQSSIQYGSGIEDDVPLILKEDNKTTNCFSKYKSLTIEPFVFLFMFAYFLNRSILTNMIMDKGCLYYLNFTDEICKNLSGHPDEKEIVEIVGNNYTLYANLMALIGAFQMIFIAPWSDKYSRKLPLTVAVIGMILSDIGLMLCSIYFDSALYFIIISRLPSELSGGFICALTIVYSHASEVSSKKFRALKYAFVEIAMSLGITFGGLVGGLLYTYGYFYAFLTATVTHFLCLPWIMFCVKETTGLDSSHTWHEKLCDFFVVESFSKGWKAAVRKREDNGRAILLLLLASMCIVVLTLESLNALGFVFIHHLYDWDQGKYSTVNTYFVASQMLFLCFAMPVLFRKFKISDSAMGVVGVLSMMGKYGLIAFSKLSVYVFYLGNILGSMNGLAMFLIRAAISKIADKDEIGRVFSFMATCEAIIPMFGTILVTKVFNVTMDTFPNVSYMMTVGFLILPLFNFAWLYIRSKRNQALPAA